MFSWFQLFLDPNTQWILLGCMLLGLSSGVIGCFAYLRKQSLMGDALSHAALPGICITFMLTGSKSILLFLVGAAIAGIIATFGIGYVTRHTRIKQDSALAIVLSVFLDSVSCCSRRSSTAGAVIKVAWINSCLVRPLRWLDPM